MFFLFSWRAAVADISPHQLISVFAEMAFAAAYEQLAVHALREVTLTEEDLGSCGCERDRKVT